MSEDLDEAPPLDDGTEEPRLDGAGEPGLDAGEPGLDAGEPGLDAGEPGLGSSMDDSPDDALELAVPDGPLLSAEESSALLDAIRSGAVEARGARPVELGSVDEPMRRAQRSIDELSTATVAALREGLLRAGTPTSSIDAEASVVTPLETFVSSTPPTAAVWTVRAGTDVVARVVIGPLLVAALLERRLGATEGVVPARPSERAPSALELRVLEPVARAIAQALLTPFVSGALLFGPSGRPGELGSPLSPCLSVTFLVTPKGGATAEVQVTLLALALGRLAAASGRTTRVVDALKDVEVDLIAVLGRCSSTVRGLLALDRGAVLRLDGAPERPVELRVDGVPVLRGMPVVKDGNLAIEVMT